MVLLLWIICVFCVLCFSCFRVCPLLPCGHLLGRLLFAISNWDFFTFPCGILGQAWYLILLIPDLCHFAYFDAVGWSACVIVVFPDHIHLLLIMCSDNSEHHREHSIRLIMHCLIYYGINGVLITNISLNLIP